jgi:hypothetical protein
MNTIKETFYVVYKNQPTHIPSYISGFENTFVPTGYYLVPYPMRTDKIVFQGSPDACGFVLQGLNAFSLN